MSIAALPMVLAASAAWAQPQSAPLPVPAPPLVPPSPPRPPSPPPPAETVEAFHAAQRTEQLMRGQRFDEAIANYRAALSRPYGPEPDRTWGAHSIHATLLANLLIWAGRTDDADSLMADHLERGRDQPPRAREFDDELIDMRLYIAAGRGRVADVLALLDRRAALSRPVVAPFVPIGAHFPRSWRRCITFRRWRRGCARSAATTTSSASSTVSRPGEWARPSAFHRVSPRLRLTASPPRPGKGVSKILGARRAALASAAMSLLDDQALLTPPALASRPALRHSPAPGEDEMDHDPSRARAGALPLHEAQILFRDFLLPGERLLWAGRPPRGIRFSASDAFLIPFSLVWGGFAIFWTLSAWWMGAPAFFVAFGFPFVAVGLYLIFGRFLRDAWIRGGTYYAVSNQRVLILRRGKRMVGRDIGRLPSLELEQKGDRGTISFEQKPWGTGRYSGRGNVPLTSRDDAFEGIAQPRLVYDLIRREADRRRAAEP